jgi:ribosomal protein S20
VFIALIILSIFISIPAFGLTVDSLLGAVLLDTDITFEELEVEYAKGVKDIDRQFEKGLIKETNTYKKNLKNIILNDFKANRGVQSADEYVSSELKKNKDINGKVDFLITEFAFKNRGKWIVYETLSAQENKIKRWVKKGIIDKNLEKELYAKLSLMNKETLPK